MADGFGRYKPIPCSGCCDRIILFMCQALIFLLYACEVHTLNGLLGFSYFTYEHHILIHHRTHKSSPSITKGVPEFSPPCRSKQKTAVFYSRFKVIGTLECLQRGILWHSGRLLIILNTVELCSKLFYVVCYKSSPQVTIKIYVDVCM